MGLFHHKTQGGGRAISKIQSLKFGGFLLAFFALDLALALLTPRLVITGHEGDLLHMLDASLRMADGELPHLDFMTPIGILGFAPVAGLLALGLPVGKATLLAQSGLLALMLPAIWWLGTTRLSRGQAWYLGAVMVMTMMAVIYGGGSTALSLSMYYNRWGWSISFLVLVTILFAPRRQMGERWVAPMIIGLGMAALAMLKMTFFVPLLLAVPLVMLAQGQRGMLARALLVGLLAAGGLLALLGVDFFAAYLDNLLAVTRPQSARVDTGVSLGDVMALPTTFVASLVLLGALLLFRKSGRMVPGLVVFILAPAFAYITYQNWGNDHKWLLLLVLYIWANLPGADEKPVLGLPARQAGLALIVAALTFIFPSVFSMATSPVRLLAASGDISESEFLALRVGESDIWLPESRFRNNKGSQPLPGLPPSEPERVPVKIAGTILPECTLDNALLSPLTAMARELEALPDTRGKRVLVADVLNALWLLGDIARVPGAAPWYYGDDSGLEAAEFLAVPLCAIKPELRKAMLEQVSAAGLVPEERYRSELMVLYRLGT